VEYPEGIFTLNMSELIQDIKLQADKLFSLLGYEEVVEVTESEGVYQIQINTQDTGILIGFHGQTLAALQIILGHILFKQTGDWLKISLNVGDYWQKREEQLAMLANRAVSEVRETGNSFTLPFLNSRERRHIHMLLGNESDIKTESVGEGRERRLVIFPAI